MQPFQIDPTGPVGAEVKAIDLRRPLDAAAVSQLKTAFYDYGLLLFRDQRISKQDQVRFSRYFGHPVPHPTNSRDRDAEVPEICIISNVEEDGRPIGALGNAELAFHADLVFLHEPGSISILHCLEAPPSGGDTYWTNGYLAYETLAEDLKTQIEHLKVVYVHRNPAYNPPTPPAHPLVATHPETGRKMLFLSPSSAQIVDRLSQAESHALLEELYAHATQPGLVWRHRWRPGDLVMWDNRATMHRRDGFDNSQRRVMHRAQMLGPVSL